MAFNENDKTPAQEMKEFQENKRNERNEQRSARNDRVDRVDENEERRGRRRQDEDNFGNDPWGMMGQFGAPINSINGSALERFTGPAKEFLDAYAPIFREKYNCEIDIIFGTTDRTRVRVESVVIAMTHARQGEKSRTLAYTLFLPTSSSIGTQYTEGERGRAGLAYSAVASDAYDSNFKRNIENLIRNEGRGVKGDIFHIGAATVPVTYDLSKEERVKSIIQYGVNVAYYQFADIFNNINDFALINLFPQADVDDRGRRRDDEVVLTSNVIFKPEEKIDLFGLPHEFDVMVEVALGRGRRGRDRDRQRNAVSLEENQTLARIGASVDFVYLGEDNYDDGARRGRSKSRFRGRSRRQEQDSVQLYGTALNITEIDTEGRDVMSMQLTALANIPLLIKESILNQALLPAGDEVRLRDPRALALEQPESFPADEISEHPTEDEWTDLMESIVQEESTFVFMHVAQTGAHSQLQSHLVAACNPDDPMYDDSIDAINDALNSLTNGKYRENGSDDLEFGVLELRQSFSGYWTDERTGERRDLNRIGYFDMLTRFGKEHPEYLDTYTRCFDSDMDQEEITARNEELLAAYTGKGYTIVDRNHVIRLNPEWLAAIADALRDSGVTIDAEGISQQAGRRRSMSTRFSTGDLQSSLFRGRRSRDRGRW